MADTVNLGLVEQVILKEIINERTSDHWTPHRRRIAAFLAREIHRVAQAQEQLQRVGFVTSNGRGNPVAHPLVRVVTDGIQRITAYRRTLSIHARALGGDPADIARRRQIRREQEVAAPKRDGLIKWPGEGGNA